MTTESTVLQAPTSVRWMAHDIACLRILIANVFLVGDPGQNDWVLVDAGMGDCSEQIVRAAENRFGAGARPRAIVLTHGHFDHVGALPTLVERWGVPVYAHALELPYLTGRSDYPPADPTVGGGAMAWLSFTYPRRAIDLGTAARALPEDGHVPFMPGWHAIHTPGHTPGHISLFRMADRALIAGDAVVTTRQESALAAIGQPPVVHRPPAYFTIDWGAARRSAQLLAALDPLVIGTGHGPPMRGAEMQQQLHRLADNFDQLGTPSHGRYVAAPAVADEGGVVSVPPPSPLLSAPAIAGLVLAGAALFAAWRNSRRRGPRRWEGPAMQPPYTPPPTYLQQRIGPAPRAGYVPQPGHQERAGEVRSQRRVIYG